MRAGEDKVAPNTAAVKDPNLIRELSDAWGSSTIVLSIEAKQTTEGKWEAYIDNGRERNGLDTVEWATNSASLRARETFITSVDQVGTKKEFDCQLIAGTTRS